MKHNAATNQIVVFVKVDETFAMIWLSRSSEVRVKVRRWPQSHIGTIFHIALSSAVVSCLALRIMSSLLMIVIKTRNTCSHLGMQVHAAAHTLVPVWPWPFDLQVNECIPSHVGYSCTCTELVVDSRCWSSETAGWSVLNWVWLWWLIEQVVCLMSVVTDLCSAVSHVPHCTAS